MPWPTSARDGGALEGVAVLRPDVVVIDVLPHDERGIEVARQIAAMSHADRVVFTSHRHRAVRLQAGRSRIALAESDVCSDALTPLAIRSERVNPARGVVRSAGGRATARRRIQSPGRAAHAIRIT